MIPLCRHILPAGAACQAPAVHDTLFCRHHQAVKQAEAQARQPAPYGVHQPLDLVYPEDRAAIQLNYFLVLQALNHQKIDNRTANTFNRLLRSCESNLTKGPLAEASREKTALRVILTPQGDEIAPPREALEAGEKPPLHDEQCPCRKCAEQYRGAAPEQHHADCQCGLCESSGQRSAVSGQEEPSDQRSAVSDQATSEGAPSLTPAPGAARVGENESQPATLRPEHCALNAVSRSASAHKLYTQEPAPLSGPDGADPADDPDESPYKAVIREYEAKSSTLNADRRTLHPAPPPGESEFDRRLREINEQVEKNKQVAREIWQRRFPDQPLDNTPRLSWNDQEDLRIAHMKQLRLQEQTQKTAPGC